jgi:hypothetical protein
LPSDYYRRYQVSSKVRRVSPGRNWLEAWRGF